MQMAIEVPSNPIDIEKEKISIHYNITGQIWNRMQMPIDSMFAYQVALQILEDNSNPKTMKQAMNFFIKLATVGDCHQL
jgi:hypothetical protein